MCLLLSLVHPVITSGQSNAKRSIDFERLADAIYIAEGGAKTRYPFGIKSIKTTGYEQARRICLRTIANSYSRWSGKGRFIDHLASTYCPVKVDRQGNANWRRNVKHWYFKLEEMRKGKK